jgi:multicomponent Na+:H+ antiporter subunit F
MDDLLLLVAAFLLLNVGAGLIRVIRGPSPADRMLAAQLFGTTGVAILLLLAEATATPALRDTALVFVLLAVVLSVAFVKRGWVRMAGPEDSDDQESGEEG